MRRRFSLGKLLLPGFCVLFAMPAFSQGTGDESAFVRSSYGDMPLPLRDDVSVNITIFESVRNNDPGSPKVFAFTPYFEFVTFPSQADDGSTVTKKYEVIPVGTNQFNVKLRLACFDDSLKSAVATKVSSSVGNTVTPDAVQVLPIYRLSVQEDSTGVSAPIPEAATPDTKLELQPVQDVVFKSLSADQKTALTKLIDKNQAVFVFTYFFKKAGTSLTSASITMDQMMQTSTFQQLTGGGGSGYITRDGMATVTTKMLNDLDIRAYIEDTADVNALIDKLLSLFFTTAKFKEDVDYQNADNLKKLSSLSIDPNGPDFEAQRIKVTHDLLTTSHDYNEVNKNLQQGEGKVGWGPFSANANFKSNQELTKAIKDSFSHDFTGENYSTIPKTVSIYQVNASDFTASTVLRQVTVRPSFFFQALDKRPVQIFPDVGVLRKSAAQVVQQRQVYRFGAEECRDSQVNRCAGIRNNAIVYDTGILIRSGNTIDLDFKYLVKEENVAVPAATVHRYSNLVCTATKVSCAKRWQLQDCIDDRKPTLGEAQARVVCQNYSSTACLDFTSTCTQQEDHWIETTSFGAPSGSLKLYSPPSGDNINEILQNLYVRFTNVGATAKTTDCAVSQLQRVPGVSGASFVLANYGSCTPFGADPSDTKAVSVFYKEPAGLSWKEGVQIALWSGVTQAPADRSYKPLLILAGSIRLH